MDRRKSLAKRIGVIVGAAILAMVLVVGGLLAGMRHHFHPAPPQLHELPPAGPLDAQRQDIRYFRRVLALDRSFAPGGRSEAHRRLEGLEAQASVLDGPHLRVQLMRIDALADNGHSRVDSEGSAAALKLPVRVADFSDGLYIMWATESHADLLGGRVTAIDGQPIDAVMGKLEQLRGGPPQWRRLYASHYLVLQEVLYGIDVAPDMKHSNWTVESSAGVAITTRLDAYAPALGEPDVFVKRWLSSDPLAGMPKEWRAVQPDRALPVSLLDFDAAFRSVRLPESCLQLVQLKSNTDQGSQKIRDFLSRTEASLRQSRPCGLILDLRYDDGGDYVNTYAFARRLPKLIPPEDGIIVLTGPSTFSAGISTAAFVKHAGLERVTILGEPVGDRLQFFSEGGRACLPNHPICVAYETGKHDYQHACTDWNVCFWLNYLFQFRVRSLGPDELIPLSFKDWRAGVDPVLDRAMTLARAGTTP